MYLIGFLSMVALPTGLHKYHASLTQMEYNPQSGSLEIVLRVFSEDLERGLRKVHGRRIAIDSGRDVEPLVFDYVAARFQVGTGTNQNAELTWVGMEIEVETTWIYLEATVPNEAPHLLVANRLFFDLETSQINTVNLKMNGRKASVTLRRGDRVKRL